MLGAVLKTDVQSIRLLALYNKQSIIQHYANSDMLLLIEEKS